jgi:hypothetical protein
MAVRAGGDQAVATRSKAWSVWGRYPGHRHAHLLQPPLQPPHGGDRRRLVMFAVDQQGRWAARVHAVQRGQLGVALGQLAGGPADQPIQPAARHQLQSANARAEQARHPRGVAGRPSLAAVPSPSQTTATVRCSSSA